MCHSLGDTSKALQHIESAIAISDNDPKLYNHLSKVLYSRAEFSKAEEAAVKAIALDPKNMEFKTTLKHVLSQKKGRG